MVGRIVLHERRARETRGGWSEARVCAWMGRWGESVGRVRVGVVGARAHEGGCA